MAGQPGINKQPIAHVEGGEVGLLWHAAEAPACSAAHPADPVCNGLPAECTRQEPTAGTEV